MANSQRAHGRYILAYHHSDGLVGGLHEDFLADAQRCAAAFSAEDRSGGRWVVHELGPEVTDPDAPVVGEQELRARRDESLERLWEAFEAIRAAAMRIRTGHEVALAAVVLDEAMRLDRWERMLPRTREPSVWEQAVADVRRRYPADVFPYESTSRDARSGTFARQLCDAIVRRAGEIEQKGDGA